MQFEDIVQVYEISFKLCGLVSLFMSMQETSHAKALDRSRLYLRGHSIINVISILTYYPKIFDSASYECLDYGLEIVPLALPIIIHHVTFAYNAVA